MLYAFEHHNPLRPVDWRFRRVIDVVRNGHPWSRSQDDDQMRAGYRFLSQRDAARTGAERDALYRKFPGLTYAFDLFRKRSAQRTRLNIEARILARQNDLQIAEQIATLPKTIYWYEALFFCVRDRLIYPDYIVDAILSQPARRNDSEDYRIIKLLAYFGGPVVLEQALHGFIGAERPIEPGEVPGFYDRMQSAQLRLKAVMAARSIEIDRHNEMQVIDAHRRIMEMERQTPQTAVNSEALQAVDGLLGSLAWEVGRPAPGSRKPSPLDEFADTSGELRADEMMQLSYERDPMKRRRLRQELQEVKTISFDRIMTERAKDSARPESN